MAWTTMYDGFVNSPSTTLSGDITDTDVTIPVTELGVFPAAPNIAVIGTGDDAETIYYGAKSAATGAGNLTTVTREYNKTGTYGAKKAWLTGETIARNFCEYDYNALVDNATDLDTRVATGANDNAIIRADGAGGGTIQGSLSYVDDNGAIYTPAGYGIGLGIAASPSYLLHIKGTAATGLPTYSDEFLDADNWTSADWTGSWAAGWVHTTGNTTVLSHDHNAVNATKYQITYTVTGRTDGSFTITFGGQSLAGITATGAWGPTTTGTGVLQITPTSAFDGAIVISIKSMTAGATATIAMCNSTGVTTNEMRATGNANTTLFIGVGAGLYNTTGISVVGIGYSALSLNTTGLSNTAIGSNALKSNTVGNYNTAIGGGALYSNITGTNNLALGAGALYTNTTGTYNTGLGLNSLYYNIGTANTGCGASSLFSNTTGGYNCAIGINALYSNTEGGYNVGIGYNALRTINTGTYNTGIGVAAGYDTNQKADATNTVCLGNGTFTTRSNQVVIGDENIVETHLRTGVYIGSTSTTAHTQPTARLHIAAGSASASTAPIKLTSGTLLTSAEAGAIEFLTDDYYASITTGPARKKIALARSDWGAWTPTLAWTGGTPAAITTVARYCQIDRVVHFHVDISSADSNAASGLTITLPVDPVDNNDYTSVSSREIAGAGGVTWSDPLAYINMDSANKKINFAAFTTGTDDQAIRIIVSGSYEVA